MKNVTISLDDAVVHDARVAAASEGKSLSRFVSEVLAEHLTKSSRRRAIRDFLDGPLWDLTDENGKLPTRLALTWNGRVSFVLNDKWQVKRVRFLDGVFPESDPADTGADAGENAADRFEADWTIATGELAQLMPELIEALGGAQEITA